MVVHPWGSSASASKGRKDHSNVRARPFDRLGAWPRPSGERAAYRARVRTLRARGAARPQTERVRELESSGQRSLVLYIGQTAILQRGRDRRGVLGERV